MTLPGPNLPDSAAGAVSVATLPTRELQSVFAGYRCFNAVQSASFQAAFATDSNLVLSAPTGSGKTAVLELAICRLLHQNLSKSFKLVYVAPTKSLCRERAKDWSSKFSAFGLTCAEVTGDTDARNMHQVKTADIIITTPEKWDSVTRRWNDSQRLVQMVKLFMVDEVHSLNSSRGATLEVVMTRMKQMARVGVRMIALSATVPNLEDLARWLGKGHDGGLALQLKFGENYRPVALERVVYGFEMGRMNKFAFDSFLAKQVYGVVAKHGKGKPSIIFCSTRQDCQNTAKAVLQAYETQPMWSRPSIDAVFADKALMQMVPAGVAFHHAGLSLADRNMVEKLFRQNVLNVLVSTSTLAVGVNLPAHLVVLKNTLVYSHGAFEEYSDLDVLQMIGRAGRPQFDTTGCAVIMTGNEKKRTYELMISGTEVLESHLHLALLEHFNAEICSGTISTVQQSIEWLKETFLYVRMQQNPAHYRLQEGHGVEETLKQMSEMNVALLEQKKLVDNIDGKLISTPKGKIMANYYLCFSSFENLDSLPTGASESDILTALCKADEFSKMSLRPGDKGMLNIMKTLPGLRFPIVGKIEHLWQKVFLAVQITPGSVDVSVLKASHPRNMTELFVHESFIRQHMLRLLSCLIDCKLLDKDATIINRALELRQAIAGKCWKTSAGVLKQIRGIGDGSLKTLVNAGITTLPKLIQSDARELERLFKRHPPFGNKLIKDAESLPSLSLSIRLSGQAVKPDGVHLQFDVRLSALCPTEWRADQHLVNFTAYTANGLLLDFRRQKMDKLLGGKQILLDVHLMKHCSNLGFLVICEDLVSCEARSSFVLEISAADYPEQNEPARDSSSDGWLEVIDDTPEIVDLTDMTDFDTSQTALSAKQAGMGDTAVAIENSGSAQSAMANHSTNQQSGLAVDKIPGHAISPNATNSKLSVSRSPVLEAQPTSPAPVFSAASEALSPSSQTLHQAKRARPKRSKVSVAALPAFKEKGPEAPSLAITTFSPTGEHTDGEVSWLGDGFLVSANDETPDYSTGAITDVNFGEYKTKECQDGSIELKGSKRLRFEDWTASTLSW